MAGCLIIGQDGKRYRLVEEEAWDKLSKPMALPAIDASKPLNEQIQELRDNCGLSQKELADGSGLTPAQLCRIEGGQVPNPHRSSINAILYTLAKVQLDKLL